MKFLLLISVLSLVHIAQKHSRPMLLFCRALKTDTFLGSSETKKDRILWATTTRCFQPFLLKALLSNEVAIFILCCSA